MNEMLNISLNSISRGKKTYLLLAMFQRRLLKHSIFVFHFYPHVFIPRKNIFFKEDSVRVEEDC
jgi:hypothetical protein